MPESPMTSQGATAIILTSLLKMVAQMVLTFYQIQDGLFFLKPSIRTKLNNQERIMMRHEAYDLHLTYR